VLHQLTTTRPSAPTAPARRPAPGPQERPGADRRPPGRSTARRVAFLGLLTAALALAGAPVATQASAATAVQAYKNHALAGLGGNTTQLSCLDRLWTAESGWNPNAQNPTSSAYGIPQFLNSTWASTGIAKTSNPNRQIDAGLIYIRNRYGTPCGAWAFWSSHRWY
jgi:Transglycosylase SLT domain